MNSWKDQELRASNRKHLSSFLDNQTIANAPADNLCGPCWQILTLLRRERTRYADTFASVGASMTVFPQPLVRLTENESVFDVCSGVQSNTEQWRCDPFGKGCDVPLRQQQSSLNLL